MKQWKYDSLGCNGLRAEEQNQLETKERRNRRFEPLTVIIQDVSLTVKIRDVTLTANKILFETELHATPYITFQIIKLLPTRSQVRARYKSKRFLSLDPGCNNSYLLLPRSKSKTYNSKCT